MDSLLNFINFFFELLGKDLLACLNEAYDKTRSLFRNEEGLSPFYLKKTVNC